MRNAGCWFLVAAGIVVAASACGQVVPPLGDARVEDGPDAGAGRPDGAEVVVDADGDGFDLTTDCDDTRADVNPRADERGAGGCDGIDRNCDGTWEVDVPGTCPTIQAALDASVGPSTIWVARGTYREHLDFRGAAARVIGIDGPEATILDGEHTGRCATFEGGEGPETELAGFTITRGRHVDRGGGILIDGASPTLRDLVITENQAPGGYGAGGGIAAGDSASLITNVVLFGNGAGYVGGAISITGSPLAVVRNAIVVGNSAGAYGGGFDLYGFTGTVENSVVAGNLAAGGGAFNVNGGGPILRNVTIHANQANTGAAFYLISSSPILTNVTSSANTLVPGSTGATSIAATTSAPVIRWSNFHDGAGGFDGVSDPIGSDGNVSLSPGFVAISSADPLEWDLHLRGSSPLIDAGDPAIADPDGSRSDLGAYGGPGAAGW